MNNYRLMMDEWNSQMTYKGMNKKPLTSLAKYTFMHSIILTHLQDIYMSVLPIPVGLVVVICRLHLYNGM